MNLMMMMIKKKKNFPMKDLNPGHLGDNQRH